MGKNLVRKVGVIADTHGLLRPEAIAKLAGSEPAELDARLRILTRAGSDPDVFAAGPLRVDGAAYTATLDGEPLDLTYTEFELLRYLMRNPRRVLSKPQILDRVWSYDFGGQANIVELYISYLRKKIDQGKEPLIHTVRGVGYMIKAPTQ